jgi:hypothetical protein
MADQVLLYISAATDLETEREVLGRAVTEVPVDLGFRVVQSPAGNGPVDLRSVAKADLHVLVMGGDIRAPVGLEWQAARQTGRRPKTFLKQGVLRTPAGQNFVGDVGIDLGWTPFKDAADLRRKVLLLLADHLLEKAARYHILTKERQRLERWRKELVKTADEVDEETRGGAGESAVILSRERSSPADGVVIGEVPPLEDEAGTETADEA